jgi:4-hydroxymandelate oxidase
MNRPGDGVPPEIRCAQDYERLAAQHLAAPTLAYLAGGSGHDRTAAANRAAFDRWSLLPRLLREFRHGHTRCRLGGAELAHPIVLAPVAHQRLAHPGAERETARAAAATDTLLLASTLSSVRLEDIAQAAGTAPRWFQLYFQPGRDATLALLRRAEAAGYGAIVVTLDATLQAPSLSALAAGFTMPADCRPANLEALAPPAITPPAAGAGRILQGLMRQAPAWDDLRWLLDQTRLPVWVKGVLHPDDARALQAAGVAGQVVSNHGGRTLDGVPASLTMLPAVRAAVGSGYPLLFDGGVRSGRDAFTALALGADAVAVGRLQVYALAVAGALGVAHLLRLLREELEACMAVTGCATADEIQRGCLLRDEGPGGARENPCC